MKSETVLFNPANSKFCVLNSTAAFIWEVLEHPQTAQQIAAKITSSFAGVKPEQAEQDVRRVLSELQGIECIVSPKQDAIAT